MAKSQPTSQQEIDNLLGIVERDRSQADLQGLHPDIRYELLYNAALQMATIVLRLSELRVGRTGHHRETFLAVRELVPEDLLPTISHFDQARRKRNGLVYDQAGTATEADLAGLRTSVSAFEKWVRDLVASQLGKDID
jgi:hypothetical protein